MFTTLTSFLALGLSAASVFAAPVESSGLVARANVGEGTYYTPGLGACGITNGEADYIVAVSRTLYDTYPGATPNPNLNPICGKKLRATYNGRSVVVAVEDKCWDCAGTYDLAFTMAAMAQLVDNPVAVGRIYGVQWSWI